MSIRGVEAIQTVAIVGSGQMGSGIGQVFATSGFSVILYDAQPLALERSRVGIEKSLVKLADKGRLDGSVEEVRGRIGWTDSLTELAEGDFLVEAIIENEDAKTEIFCEMDRRMAKDVVFASNTSSISITRLAACSHRPENFIGMHFMNPAPLMALVEVVRGLATPQEVIDLIDDLAARLGKQTVHSEDSPGFIVNRILLPMINEAVYALSESVGGPQDIDQAMKLGTNQPMGPLALADLIGLDTVLFIMQVMHQTFGESKYRPCPLLRKYVDAGYLGRKAGRGFYRYD